MADADSARRERRTLGDLVLSFRARTGGSRTLLRAADRTVSAADVVADLHALALAWRSRGFEAGHRVAILVGNRPEWPIVDLAVQLLGGVTVPLEPGLPEDLLGFALRNAAPRWIAHDGDERIPRLLPSLPSSPELLDVTTELVAWLGEGSRGRAETPLERFRGLVEPDGLSTLVYTAGVEADPVGVRHSHRSSLAHAEALAAALDPEPGDVLGLGLPLAHPAGRAGVLAALDRGFEIRLDGTPEATLGLVTAPVLESVAEMLATGDRPAERWALDVGARWAEARRTGLVGPFLAAERWLADRLVLRDRAAREGLRRLRRLLVIGRTRPGTLDRIEAAGLPVSPTWGLAEAWPVATAEGERRVGGASGCPLPGVELRVGEGGGIELRGDGLMLGTWRQAESSLRRLERGWLRTGDVGRLVDGHLMLDGRAGQSLRIGDRSIGVELLEQVLETDVRIDRALVPSGTRPRVVALVRPAAGVTGEACDEAVWTAARAWPAGWRLDRWAPMPPGELERTSTGVLRRARMESRWSEEIAALFRE